MPGVFGMRVSSLPLSKSGDDLPPTGLLSSQTCPHPPHSPLYGLFSNFNCGVCSASLQVVSWLFTLVRVLSSYIHEMQ